jgi:hypothetical protein
MYENVRLKDIVIFILKFTVHIAGKSYAISLKLNSGITVFVNSVTKW